jgi:DNA polymerase-3 subunit gamma/tau
LVQALSALDAPAVLDEVARIAELTPDFTGVLQEVLGILHRIALFQQVPSTLADDDPDRDHILRIAEATASEDVQLFYQIGLVGQQDLMLAPDPRTGIEMVLLRMLAFRPDTAVTTQCRTGQGTRSSVPDPSGAGAAKAVIPEVLQGPGSAAAAALADARRVIAPERNVSERPPRGKVEREIAQPARVESVSAKGPNGESREIAELPGAGPLRGPSDWHGLVGRLGLRGVASELASNCEFSGWDGRRLCLVLDPACQHMRVASAEERLRAALEEVLGSGLKLEIEIAQSVGETPARRRLRLDALRLARAEALMGEDPVARALQDQLDARWVSGSIEPMDEMLPEGGEKA